MGFIQEFKQFAMRGNVVDLAVAVVIGSAFGKIIDSLVKDVVMPPIGALLGGVDFKHLYFDLSGAGHASMEAAEKAGAPLVKYGAFINSMVDFIIIAFAIFVAVKAINSLKRQAAAVPPAPAETPEEILLLREIRDSLKQHS